MHCAEKEVRHGRRKVSTRNQSQDVRVLSNAQRQDGIQRRCVLWRVATIDALAKYFKILRQGAQFYI
jgi:hypothetical protein